MKKKNNRKCTQFVTITKLRLNSQCINMAWARAALVHSVYLVCNDLFEEKEGRNEIKRSDKAFNFHLSSNQHPLELSRFSFFYYYRCTVSFAMASISILLCCVACLHFRRVASCVSTKWILIRLFYAYKFKRLE